MTPELVLSIIASLLAVGSGLYGWRNSRADTSKLYTEAAANLIAPLKERVAELETTVKDLTMKNAVLEANLGRERSQRRKVEASFKKLRSDHESQRLQHEGVIELLTEKIHQQDVKIEKLQIENQELRHGVRILVKQLREANIEPRWEPRDE